jgi:MFS family permease
VANDARADHAPGTLTPAARAPGPLPPAAPPQARRSPTPIRWVGMYNVQDSTAVVRAHRDLARGRLRVAPTVVLLGLTSMFTDISSEMVATVLPLYLLYSTGLSLVGFGVIDGIYNGAAALVQFAGGLLGDRLRRHKEVAVAGYGLSALCRPLLLILSTPAGIGLTVGLDRVGKGLRTAPRDALISLSTPKSRLGTAFGVHRALDTTGAMLGPVIAFVVLESAPENYRAVFGVSLFAALIGLAILVLFVQNRKSEREPARKIDVRQALGLLRDHRLRALTIVTCALSLVTISDAFLYVGLQRHIDFDFSFFPLLFAGTSLSYMLLAAPVGRLADRVGRRRVFIGGYVLLAIVYTALLLPSLGTPGLLIYLTLFGGYYAATNGVLSAITSSMVSEELRGSGLALVASLDSIASLLASVAFGTLWTLTSNATAVAVFGIGLVVAIAVAAVVLTRVGSE